MTTDAQPAPATSPKAPAAAPQADDLTLAQCAALTSGAAFWLTKEIGDTPALVLTDGPHGVRRQDGPADHIGILPSLPATCFPPAVSLAQTWDAGLAERVGAALGSEARSLGVDVLLGPGVNLKRDPRCGRNFEYLSEDPLLTGVLGTAWVRGLQSQGVGASVKHFAANEVELDRMRVSSDVDERTLRELYLRPFERIVREAGPWTIMAAYNRINGTLATEHRELLTGILREEWGFDGVVLSDWGAVSDRVRALSAGLDLQMPGGDTEPDSEIVAAVERGELDEAVVSLAASRLRELGRRSITGRDLAAPSDTDANHALAREVAQRAIVLLKNDDALLPLQRSGTIAVVGEFARTPRYQGGGSSHVNPTRVDVPLDKFRESAGDAAVTFAPGFALDGSGDAAALRAEAVDAARASDTAVVFLGLADRDESEGVDRTHIDLAPEQLTLLAEIVAAQPRTVVVLAHGSVVDLTRVRELAPAVLDGALLGQAVGSALADVLFGDVNPSGRLAETVPVRLQDAPSYLTFPGEHGHVVYGEGVFMGYRGYDRRETDVAFPFGHGLSYTSFAYGDLVVSADDDGIDVTIRVTNTGSRAGREIVQCYVSVPGSAVARAPQELKAFTGVELEPGQCEQVRLRIARSDLAYWDVRVHGWVVEGGEYRVSVGASSRDLRATASAEIGGDPVRLHFTPDSTIGELMASPVFRAVLEPMITARTEQLGNDAGEALGMDVEISMSGMPFGRLRGLSGGRGLTRAQLADLLARANEEVR
ncbi:glycoside hydrolase family 3 C-terminal domain-containing protein [Nocardiopsis dassonvillei]|uniref:glycoside hydrolase family 3 C-terminal domain-containing protein n=1 Tax=Nocardiopsis dassonvillei TaxID=2014 RepID=UPI00200DF855|nr:glycoside hydrolase family 3 C-terminal domain-containing protein [Nocardiopsis dassonvillei]MCK9873490.1 glycoside hydrolase family 3 C-terminal domain-containing protein [Nocardiopsis dassonvillei]